MKFYVNTKELSNSLSTVIKAIPAKSIEPIFSHILLKAEAGVLKLTGSDGQFSISANLEAEVETGGAVAIPGKEFANLVKTFDTPSLEISSDGKICQIKTGKSSYKLNVMNEGQFPIMPCVEGFSFALKQSELKSILEETTFALAPQEEVRAVLKGVLFAKESKDLVVVAADGRRMAMRKMRIEEQGEDFERVLPKKLISDLHSLLKPVENSVKFIMGESLVSVTVENISIISGTISGKFPNYKQVIPGSRSADDVVINRVAIASAMRRACLMAQDQESPNLLKFAFNESGIVITANTQDVGEAYEEVPALGCSEKKVISFNGKYLLDCFTALSVTDVVLNVGDPNSPATVKKSVDDGGFLAVVMPVRLK